MNRQHLFKEKLLVWIGAVSIFVFVGSLFALWVSDSWPANIIVLGVGAISATAVWSVARHKPRPGAHTNTQIQDPVPAIVRPDKVEAR